MNLRDLLTDLSIDFKEHGESPLVSENWLGVVCPFCGQGTGKPGLGIHLHTMVATCWKCGRHTLAEVLREFTGKAWSVLKGQIKQLDRGDASQTVDRPSGRYTPPAGVGPLQDAHRRYLTRRGFDPDEIATTWGVRAIGAGGALQWRLFLPVVHQRKDVSWTTRAVGNVELRYISADPPAESVPLKHTLYGAHLARHAVAVVEGPTDAWRIGPGAVATYGLSITPHQVALVARYPVRIICLDNEPTAQRRASALCDELSAMPGETYRVCLSGPDPDSSPADEIAELRRMLT